MPPCSKQKKAECRSPCTWVVGSGCKEGPKGVGSKKPVSKSPPPAKTPASNKAKSPPARSSAAVEQHLRGLVDRANTELRLLSKHCARDRCYDPHRFAVGIAARLASTYCGKDTSKHAEAYRFIAQHFLPKKNINEIAKKAIAASKTQITFVGTYHAPSSVTDRLEVQRVLQAQCTLTDASISAGLKSLSQKGNTFEIAGSADASGAEPEVQAGKQLAAMGLTDIAVSEFV